MNRKKNKPNDTFKFDTPTDYNACVGKNGFNDIGVYEDGYDAAVKLLIKGAKKNQELVDPLIYPIVFSARHRVELFLKHTTTIMETLNKNSNSKIVLRNHIRTHDLKILWEYLISLSNVDRRYTELIPSLEPYVTDYFDIDLTGETFRYPYSQDEKHHLDDFSHINVLVFEEQYKKMTKVFEKFEFLSMQLLLEYAEGTFLDGISRRDIELISKELPPSDLWINDEFNQVKMLIKEKYKIGSKKLSDIINIIKNHREFSANIGKLVPVREIDAEKYSFFRKCFDEFQNEEKEGGRYKQKQFVVSKICSKMSTIEIASLVAFRDIGYFSLYSEQYDSLVKKYKIENPTDLVNDYLLDSFRVIEWIESGMKKCAQNHFINL